MKSYEDLEHKYQNKLEKNIDFKVFLDKILDDYFKTEDVIEHLFEFRNQENRLISEKEIEIMGKDEKLYTKLLALCGREKKAQLDKVVFLIEANKQDLIELYSKEFYKLGIKDGKSLKKTGFN